MNQPTSLPPATAQESVDYDPFGGSDVQRVAPTTEAQREIWLADRISPEASLAYNESVSLRMEGPLDVDALARALQALADRHEALRSTIGPEGTELFVAAAVAIPLAQVDASALDAAAREARVAALRRQAAQNPFDLGAGPLLRATLVTLSAAEHELILAAHHIICDGWSFGVIARDLMALYRAAAAGQYDLEPTLPPAFGLGDYALELAQPEALRQEALDEQYWVAKFDRSVPTVDLPADRSRAALRTFTSQREDRVIDAALAERVRRFGAANGATLFATLYGMFAGLVARLGGHDEVIVGMPVAGQATSGHPQLVGHCVNLLPIRLAVDMAQEAGALVRHASTTLLDDLDHGNVTLGSLLKRLQIARDPSRVPLVPVLFNLDSSIPSSDLSDPQLQVSLRANPRLAENSELFLNISQADGALVLECQYNTDLFDRDTIARWLDLYATALDRCAANPALPLADAFAPTAAETAMLEGFQGARVDYDAQLRVDARFDAQAARQPDAPAVACGDIRWSYRELQRHANALATALRAQGVAPGDLVGLCCDRSAHMVAALYGILKSGAGYVPLDPSLPIERLKFMADDAGLRHVVVDPTTTERWQDTGRALVDVTALEAIDAAADTAGHAAHVAYVIYTSGSTGKPKGVKVPHHTIGNLLAALRVAPGMGPHHVSLAMTTLSFDLSVYELIQPLAMGAQVVVADKPTTMDGQRLRALIEREHITSIGAAPSTWRLLLDAGWQGNADVLAMSGGEPLPPELARELLGKVGQLWNAYGPTEITLACTVHRVTEPVPPLVPIGKPIANTRMAILDEQQRPLPIGVRGEIYIAGDGVTQGYLNRPELTAERFLAAPTAEAPERRWYRSGDIGRWLASGVIECQGRVDQQVKVRGYRVELGEIEANLASHPAIERVVVITREDQPGDVRIVAYVVSRGPMPDAAELRAHLASQLPAYMIPQHFVAMTTLPLYASGKVDRNALPPPEKSQVSRARARVAPRTDDEALVLAAMEDVLHLPGMSVDDDFFAVGGHSLLAARLMGRLNRDLQVQLQFRTVFEATTAEKLALAVARARLAGAPRREPFVHVPDRRTAPLSVMQERILFMEQLQPGRAVYNAPSGHRLTGALDVPAFIAAFREVVRRHSTLRTYMANDDEGNGIQAIAPTVDFDVPMHDLTGIALAEREAHLLAAMMAIAETPIDIHTAPLFNTALFKVSDNEHAFVFVPHHLIWDGWSFDLLQIEMAAIYGAYTRGEPSPLPEPALSHGDYTEWLGRWMQQEEYQQQLRFWKERFAAAPVPVVAQTDMPRRAGVSGEGRALAVAFDRQHTERLRAIARSADVTLGMLLMAAFSMMMGKALGNNAVVIGVPVRGREAPELEQVMGFFTNLLPLHLQMDPTRSFPDHMRYIKQELLAITSHALIPFERIAAEPDISAHAQGAGLYHAIYSFQDARERPSDFGAGVQHQQIHLRQRGATDGLGLWLMDKPNGMEGAFNYNSDIYLAETGEALRTRLLELLERIVQAPDAPLETLFSAEGSPSARVLERMGSRPAERGSPAGPERPEAAQLLLPEQAELAQIWAGILGLDVNEIHVSDNFFDLGGDSLLAMRAVQQSEQALGVKIEARRYVFESLAQLAATAAAPREPAAVAAEPPPDSAARGLIGRVFSAFGRK